MRHLLTTFLVLVSLNVFSQDTISVFNIDQAVYEAKKGNYVSVTLINDTSSIFPIEFFSIADDKLVGLVIDNCRYTILPQAISNYENLYYFRYSWFYFADCPLKSFPDFIPVTPSLKHLLIEGPKLSGIPSLSKLTSLETLSLYMCHLPSFPNEVLELKTLIELKLACNKFTSIPDNIDQLSNLRSLEFEGGACGATPISTIPASIGNLKNLESFSLGYAKTPIKRLPDSFYSLTELKHFECNGCGLESISEEIGNFKQLTSLQLSNLSFFQAFPDALFDLPNLKWFRFYQYGEEADDELLEQQGRINEWGKSLEGFDFDINIKQ